jgi:hypothetical protein
MTSPITILREAQVAATLEETRNLISAAIDVLNRPDAGVASPDGQEVRMPQRQESRAAPTQTEPEAESASLPSLDGLSQPQGEPEQLPRSPFEHHA